MNRIRRLPSLFYNFLMLRLHEAGEFFFPSRPNWILLVWRQNPGIVGAMLLILHPWMKNTSSQFFITYDKKIPAFLFNILSLKKKLTRGASKKVLPRFTNITRICRWIHKVIENYHFQWDFSRILITTQQCIE